MKKMNIHKTIILVSFLTVTRMTLAMQMYTDDTIPLRYRNYYYTDWYDECDSYKNNGRIDSARAHLYGLNGDTHVGYRMAKYEYTSSPLQVKGLVALVRPDFYQSHGWPPLSDDHAPEYMYLLCGMNRVYTVEDSISPGRPGCYTGLLLDSVRFDTVVPRVMTLSQGCDSVPPHYCLVYEAFFDKPISVDSAFYLCRTDNGSQTVQNSYNLPQLQYTPLPRYEINVRGRQDYLNTCSPKTDSAQWCHAKGQGHTMEIMSLFDTVTIYPWDGTSVTELRIPPPFLYEYGSHYYPEDPFGWMFPIVENYKLDVYSDSLPIGDVDGSGIYYNSLGTEIRAIPHAGYVFTHWNDGNTENPRIVYLSQDTSFTAYFSDAHYYEVQTSVNNMEWGYVEGGGVYAEQSVIELTAVPNEGYRFVKWSDGVADNPRTVTVLSDTMFNAWFYTDSTLLGISNANAMVFSIVPNPAEDIVTVKTTEEGIYHVEIYDNLGCCRLRYSSHNPQCVIDVRELPAGQYLMCIRSGKNRGSRRFVKQ